MLLSLIVLIGAQYGFPILGEGIEKDLFGRTSVSPTAPTARGACILPVGGTIAGACKTPPFHKGLKENGGR
jgi:hypothetical protein